MRQLHSVIELTAAGKLLTGASGEIPMTADEECLDVNRVHNPGKLQSRDVPARQRYWIGDGDPPLTVPDGVPLLSAAPRIGHGSGIQRLVRRSGGAPGHQADFETRW